MYGVYRYSNITLNCISVCIHIYNKHMLINIRVKLKPEFILHWYSLVMSKYNTYIYLYHKFLTSN